MRTLLVWLALVAVSSLFGEQDNNMYLFAGKFKNETPHNYIVYIRDRALEGKGGQLFIAQSALWQPIMLLKAGEEGELEVLLRDPDQFGSQLKLVPQTKDATYPNVYIKGFIPTSGNCGENWWIGPASILIAADEDLINNPLKDLNKTGTIRYCGFRKSYIKITIEPDGIVVKNEHNSKILEPKKVPFASLKQEERDEKK